MTAPADPLPKLLLYLPVVILHCSTSNYAPKLTLTRALLQTWRVCKAKHEQLARNAKADTTVCIAPLHPIVVKHLTLTSMAQYVHKDWAMPHNSYFSNIWQVNQLPPT